MTLDSHSVPSQSRDKYSTAIICYPIYFTEEGILIMNGPTKRQHYVWRNYLAAWTKTNSSNGQIMCLRDKKFFPVSLMKIAQENCFYGVMGRRQESLLLRGNKHHCYNKSDKESQAVAESAHRDNPQ